MPAISLTTAQAQLEQYLLAERAVLTGQSYEIAGRKLTRADLKTIQEGVSAWSARVDDLAARSRGRGRARTIVVGG